MPHSSSAWKKVQQGSILLGCIVITLLSLEIVTIHLGASSSITVNNLNAISKTPQKTQLIYTSKDPDQDLYIQTETGLRLRKNIFGIINNHKIHGQSIEIKTNRLGYRHESNLLTKDFNDFRILALGDSITLADYVPIEKTYPAQIEYFLKQSTPSAIQGKNIQVINAGVGSIGTESELAILLEGGLSIQPDVVTVGLYYNDANEDLNLKIMKPPKNISQSALVNFIYNKVNTALLTNHQTKLTKVNTQGRENFAQKNPIAQSPEKWKEDPSAFNKIIYDYYIDFGYAWDDQFWKKTEELFKVIKQVTDENNIKLVVILFPIKHQVQADFVRDEPNKHFERVMNNLQIAHLDLYPLLRRQYQLDQKDLFYDQCHYTPEGNTFVGKAIAEYLERNVL